LRLRLYFSGKSTREEKIDQQQSTVLHESMAHTKDYQISNSESQFSPSLTVHRLEQGGETQPAQRHLESFETKPYDSRIVSSTIRLAEAASKVLYNKLRMDQVF
jgi:hypothetical protein